MTDTVFVAPPGFDAEGFRLRAQRHDPEHAFGPEPAHLGHGDHVLNPGLVSGLVGAKLGGSVDPEDGSVEIAAMREAEEEIGLDRRFVEPVGRLPIYMTTTGFRITPVLAVVKPGYALTANPVEVDEVFETPLSFLMNPANHRRESRVWEGIERHYYVMPYGEHHIWGVTAGIIRTMYERLYA